MKSQFLGNDRVAQRFRVLGLYCGHLIFEQQGIPRSSNGFRVFSVPINLKAFLDPTLDLVYCWRTILMGLGSFADSDISA